MLENKNGVTQEMSYDKNSFKIEEVKDSFGSDSSMRSNSEGSSSSDENRASAPAIEVLEDSDQRISVISEEQSSLENNSSFEAPEIIVDTMQISLDKQSDLAMRLPDIAADELEHGLKLQNPARKSLEERSKSIPVDNLTVNVFDHLKEDVK